MLRIRRLRWSFRASPLWESLIKCSLKVGNIICFQAFLLHKEWVRSMLLCSLVLCVSKWQQEVPLWESLWAWPLPMVCSLCFSPGSTIVVSVISEGVKSITTALSHFLFCRDWHRTVNKFVRFHQPAETLWDRNWNHFFFPPHWQEWLCALSYVSDEQYGSSSFKEFILFPIWAMQSVLWKNH